MARPTLKDVASRAGVSVSTVSYALNDASTLALSEKTKSRVRRIARELGYVPNGLARSLQSQASRSIGMLLGKPLTSARYAAIAEGLAAGLRADGYHLALLDESYAVQSINDVRGRRLDGLVFIGHDDQGVPDELARAVGEHDVPFVAVDCGTGGDRHYSTVDFDYGLGVQHAFADFARRGIRTVLYLRPDILSPAEDARALAISDESRERPMIATHAVSSGITVDVLAQLDADSNRLRSHQHEIMQRVDRALATAGGDPAMTAVLCAWGADAEAAYRAASAFDSRVRVTALAAGSLSTELWVGLTYSRLPLELAGRECARLITASTRGGAPEHVVLAPDNLKSND